MQTQSCSVYRATSPSGKRYYGISKDVVKRWSRHRADADKKVNRPLSNAIAAYGFDAMQFEVLFTEIGTDAVEKCKEAEVFLIEFDNTLIPNGYNVTIGGDMGIGMVLKTEAERAMHGARVKAGQARTGAIEKIALHSRLNHAKPEVKARHFQSLVDAAAKPGVRERKSASAKAATARPEYKEKWKASIDLAWSNPEKRAAQSAKIIAATNNAAYKQHMSAKSKARASTDAGRKQIEDSLALARLSVQRKVVCIEAGIEFESIALAKRWAKENGRPANNISAVISGKRQYSGGYTWKYV